jgi:hypothetical protein
MNAWPQWVGAIGIFIEFIGFAILGFELMQTNKKALDEAKLLAAQRSLFDTLALDFGSISDPSSGSTLVEGGILGHLIESIPRREAEAARSRTMILTGVSVSAIGVVFQIVGAFGQAWPTNTTTIL